MEFLTFIPLAYEVHYASNIEAKQKGKTCFMNKPTGQTSEKKLPSESDNFKNPSQLTPSNPDHYKKKFQKDKRYHNKQIPTRKWCDCHISE